MSLLSSARIGGANYGEDRFILLGMVEEHLLAVAYTYAASVRASFRRALPNRENDDAIMRKPLGVRRSSAKIDWSRADAMTAAAPAAARADPDNEADDRSGMEGRATGAAGEHHPPRAQLSQEDFAGDFHIPIGTLRDWEQGRKEPDAAARAYLRVIASEPDTVRKALLPRPRPGVTKRKREAGDVARR